MQIISHQSQFTSWYSLRQHCCARIAPVFGISWPIFYLHHTNTNSIASCYFSICIFFWQLPLKNTVVSPSNTCHLWFLVPFFKKKKWWVRGVKFWKHISFLILTGKKKNKQFQPLSMKQKVVDNRSAEMSNTYCCAVISGLWHTGTLQSQCFTPTPWSLFCFNSNICKQYIIG